MVAIKHTLKKAMLYQVIHNHRGAEVAYLLMGGLAVTESRMHPERAGQMVDAILHRDIPVVQTMVVITAFIVVFVNLIEDLLYAWLDPRSVTAKEGRWPRCNQEGQVTLTTQDLKAMAEEELSRQPTPGLPSVSLSSPNRWGQSVGVIVL